MITRRRFLVNCSVLTATVAAAPVGAASPSRRAALALDGIQCSDFEACVGSRFRVVLPGGPDVKLELFKVQPKLTASSNRLHDGSADEANEKFSLVFRGPLDRPLGQDSYTFARPGLGRFLLLFAPIISMDPQRLYYEAVFNRPPLAARLGAKTSR